MFWMGHGPRGHRDDGRAGPRGPLKRRNRPLVSPEIRTRVEFVELAARAAKGPCLLQCSNAPRIWFIWQNVSGCRDVSIGRRCRRGPRAPARGGAALDGGGSGPNYARAVGGRSQLVRESGCGPGFVAGSSPRRSTQFSFQSVLCHSAGNFSAAARIERGLTSAGFSSHPMPDFDSHLCEGSRQSSRIDGGREKKRV